MSDTPKALYVHIPFCDRICSYCDFAKVLCNTFSEEAYLDRLFKELDEWKIPFDSLDTIYIGGGTPSSLSKENLRRLLSTLHERFLHVKEFTMEANPESLSTEKIQICLENGVNRISLGAQSGDDKTLSLLRRSHSIEDLLCCCDNLHKAGLDNFNLDFIYGLPSMTMEDLKRDIDLSLSLKSKHLSYYALQIEEGTLLYNQKVHALDDDRMREMYDFILKELEKEGYFRYEVSNFARKGYESLHNLTYWHDEQYYAIGLSAASYIGSRRLVNTRSMNHYLAGDYHRNIDIIDEKGEEFEFLMLNLRLASGFSIQHFNSRFHKDFLVFYKKEIKKVKDYIEIVDGYFRIRKEYLYTMDAILLDLLKD